MKSQDAEILSASFEAFESWWLALSRALDRGSTDQHELRKARAGLIEAIDRLVSETELGQ